MKRSILFISIAIAFCQTVTAQETFIYTDATTLTVGGQICGDTYEPFSRLPGKLKGVSREAVWSLGRTSAGVYVKFVSDAGLFNFRWTSSMKKSLNNMAEVGVRGLALYAHDKGEWVYVGTARPNTKDATSEYKISCSKLKGQEKEYLLYLSLYDGVKELEIGIPEGSSISRSNFNSPCREKPVIIYGTSILQGASASHPGMAGTNMLSRKLGREVINLGFSGNALLDLEIAALMAAYPDPGVYVMDNLPNGSPELTREKLEIFFRVLRDAHPDTPVVFVEHPIYPGVRFDFGREEFCVNRNIALKDVFERLKLSGEENIYYVSSEKMLLDDNIGTIEGTHFTDIGFTKWTDCLFPTLKKLYRKRH